jgi:hypothetical protein
MIRVQVNIDESIFPELAAHLKSIPVKGRAEKIRVLAVLGISVLDGHQPNPVSGVVRSQRVPPSPSIPLVKGSMAGLRKGLSG